MSGILATFLNSYAKFSDEEIDFVASKFITKTAKNGQYLFEPGKVCNEFILIVKGITRIYLIDEKGKEIVVWFGFAHQIGSDVQSFISGNPTKYFVQVIDDLEYISISKTDFLKISDTVQAWNAFQAKFWSECVVHIIERLVGHLYQSAESRYEILLNANNKEYMQLIPQKYLASFLGITQTSLSRLRKQMYTKTHSTP